MGVYDEIKAERTRQDDQWGQEHDDQHTAGDWEWLVGQYGDTHTRSARDVSDMAGWRKRMLQAAALAVAAVEWYDRQPLCSAPSSIPALPRREVHDAR